MRILKDHLDRFGTAPDGRLFVGPFGGQIEEATYLRVWQEAREAALTPAEVASPLARRPYDLRHAAVSTWLNASGDPSQVAEWAGHSVAVLLRVYAKCIVGQDDAARRRIEDAMSDDETPAGHRPRTASRGLLSRARATQTFPRILRGHPLSAGDGRTQLDT